MDRQPSGDLRSESYSHQLGPDPPFGGTPICEGGLVPVLDGLGWRIALSSRNRDRSQAALMGHWSDLLYDPAQRLRRFSADMQTHSYRHRPAPVP